MPAAPQPRAFRDGVFNMLDGFFHPGSVNQRPDVNTRFEAIAHLQRFRFFHEVINEALINPTLNVNAIGRDAGLTGIAKLREHGAVHGLLQICVVKD